MRSMKITALVLTAVLGLCGPSMSGLLRADDTPATQPSTRPHGEHHSPAGPIVAALKATTPTVTEEEHAQIKPIVKAWVATNKDQLEKLHADMKAAHEAGDKAKMKEIHTEMAALMKGLVDQITPLLTADQQTSFKAALQAERKEHGPGHHPDGAAPAQQ